MTRYSLTLKVVPRGPRCRSRLPALWARLAACVLVTRGLHGSTAHKVGRPEKARTGIAVETPTPIQSYHMGKKDHGPAFHPYDSSAIPSVVALDNGIFETLVQDNSSNTSVWFVDFFQYTSDPKFRHTPDVVQGSPPPPPVRGQKNAGQKKNRAADGKHVDPMSFVFASQIPCPRAGSRKLQR